MASDEKGVIFSQFTEYLDLIEAALNVHGHSFTRIDGSVSVEDRYEAMKALDAEDGPRFMLISIHAGGEGITLTRWVTGTHTKSVIAKSMLTVLVLAGKLLLLAPTCASWYDHR
jgi:hypothetical protein